MKIKILLLTLFFIELFTVSIYAVPAYPYPIKYKQPDGSEITIQLKGDERVHWAETSDGYTLLSNGKSGWEYALTDANGDLKTSGILAREVGKRTVNELKMLKVVSKNNRFSAKQVKTLKSVWEAKFGSEKLIGVSDFFRPNAINATSNDGRRKVFTPTGTKKLIMILIEYTDVKFTKTRQNFVDLMNTQDYNLNGAQGSVRQYFYEMSYGQFNVETVVAPSIYTADNDMAYYGAPDGTAHDIRANALMLEAIQKANPDVDYTQYDNDGDGSIDGIYIIYAGYGEASSGIVNTIWPHAGGVAGTFDGKTASKYSCSNELNYNGASNPGTLTTIGVICHEFGHVCGAPDYYDTDYTTGGQFSGTGTWDLMTQGVYNGAISGSSPAHFNPFEKIRAGWLTPKTLTKDTSIIDMPDITAFPVVYKFNTTTENEYYLLENRQQTGFNTYCPGHGLMIYHYSQAIWDANRNKTAPQGFYPVCASATTSPTTTSNASSYGSISSGGCPFPGTSSKTYFTDDTTPTAKSWAGNNTYKPITGITENISAKTIGFDFMDGGTCTPPITQASNLTFSDIQDNKITVNWTRGNGDKVIVLARRNSAVNTTLLNGTTFTANGIFQQGDLVDPDTYVIYNGTETSVTFTELLKNSTYYFAVFEYSSSSQCYLSPGLTGSTSTTGCAACTPTSTPNSGMGITNVSFNTINHGSSSSLGYANYSEIVTEVTVGQTYNLTLDIDTWGYTMFTKAWIDWNNDCVFQSSEEYDLGSSANSPVTKAITIPSNAYSGYVTLRVRTSWDAPPTSCNGLNYSDAEDYTLKVTGGCTPPTVQASGFSVTNIQNEQMTLNWTRGNGNKVLVIAHQGTVDDESPIGFDLTANPEFGLGTQIGTGNYVVYNGTGNSVTVTGLLPNKACYFAVYEYNSPENCVLMPALKGNASTTGCSYAAATATTNTLGYVGITNVKLNTIDNTSSISSAYTDYSQIFTNVIPGNSYTLTINTYSYTNTIYTKVWIDWNKDCIFDNSELYNLGSSTNDAILTKQIVVPANAFSGFVTMRIRTGISSSISASGNSDYSEAEDYSLKITGSCTPPTVQATNFSASNIQNEQMTINWTRGNGDKVLVIARQGSAVDSYLIGATDLTANAEFGSGTQIGAGNYVVYNGTNNNVTVKGLIPGLTYYFAVYEYNTPNNCILHPALIGNNATIAGVSYCIPTETTATTSIGITNVTFNTINNSSATSNLTYTNYNTIQTTVVKNQSYNLSISVYTGGNPIVTKAWIDWNKNGSFDLPSEEYDLGSNSANINGLTPNSPLSILVPSNAADGAIRMRVITRFSSAPTACGNNNYSEAEDYTIRVISPSTTWNGSSWSVTSPTSLYNVIIDGNYNDAGFTCNNLTINPGKQVTIASGTLTVNGNILLQSDETNGTATLVNNGTVNTAIKGTVQQYLATTRNWYISSPVSNATFPLGYTGYLYREPGDNTGYIAPATIYWKTVAAGEALAIGTGYIALPANDGLTFSFNTGSTGHINDGDISIPVTRTAGKTKEGYNLVGNPYPSYLNWMSVIDAANTGTTNMSTTMWYRTKNNATTSVYVFDTYNETANTGTNNNGLGAVTGMIPPMQAFWVRVAAGNTNGTLALNNTMRSHQDIITNKFRLPSANNTTQQVLRLKVSDGQNGDEAILLFNPNASNGIDNYDSPKMMNDNASAISEIYTKVGTEKLVINGMNTIPYNIEIPLYFNVNASTASTFTIKAAELNNFEEGTPIYVKNNLTGEQQLISDGSSYTFEPAEGINNDPAFSVIIKAPGSITDITNRETDGIFLYGNANKQIVVSVKNLSCDNSSLSVYNTVGQKVASSTITADKTLIEVPVSGVYMVAVNNGGKTTNFKVIVK